LINYAFSRRCRCTATTAAWAAAYNDFETLEELINYYEVSTDSRVIQFAALNGHLEMIKYARSKGCSFNKWACHDAASNGHLEVLKWLRENECPWSKQTCVKAAEGNHLEVLVWLHQNECPWDKWTCIQAAGYGHLEILKYALQHGCPYDKKCMNHAWNNEKWHIMQWLTDNKYK
jgi:hypothetical protein